MADESGNALTGLSPSDTNDFQLKPWWYTGGLIRTRFPTEYGQFPLHAGDDGEQLIL
ncbi:MAG: hypothetical protein IIC97_11345 [Chloroflexi bacterium]|nr:hypothetical protein [Chloroflexota bacterium]